MTEHQIGESRSDSGPASSSTVTRRDVLKRTTATVGLAAGGLGATGTASAQRGQGIVVGGCPTRQYFVVLERVEGRELACGEDVVPFERCYRIGMLKRVTEEEYCVCEPRTLCTTTDLEAEAVYAFQGRLPCECNGGSGSNCRVLYEPAERMFEGLRPCEPMGGEECVDFSGFAVNTPANFPFTAGRFTFELVNPQSSFSSRFVDSWPSGAPDGNPELQYPDDGVVISVPTATSASVAVVPFATERIELEAYDSAGNLVDETRTSSGQQQKYDISVQGQDITQLVVKEGANEGMLLEVCVETEAE